MMQNKTLSPHHTMQLNTIPITWRKKQNAITRSHDAIKRYPHHMTQKNKTLLPDHMMQLNAIPTTHDAKNTRYYPMTRCN